MGRYKKLIRCFSCLVPYTLEELPFQMTAQMVKVTEEHMRRRYVYTICKCRSMCDAGTYTTERHISCICVARCDGCIIRLLGDRGQACDWFDRPGFSTLSEASSMYQVAIRQWQQSVSASNQVVPAVKQSVSASSQTVRLWQQWQKAVSQQC